MSRLETTDDLQSNSEKKLNSSDIIQQFTLANQQQDNNDDVTNENRELSIISQPAILVAGNLNHRQQLQLTTDNNDIRHQQQQQQQQQWIQLTRDAAQNATQEVRQRMMLASDQFGHSIRQLYASASSITDQLPPAYHNIPGIVPYYRGRSNGPPPSYDDVVNPYAAPPSYQSLFGQMREARKSSRSLLDLLKKLLIILLSTLGCTILISFMILIPFTMIIIGAIYIDDCKVEHIPTFLLIGGVVWASKNIIHCYAQRYKKSSQQSQHFNHNYNDQDQQSAQYNNNNQQHSQQPQQQDLFSITSAQLPPASVVEYSSTVTQPNSDNNNQSFCLKSSICESLLNCVLIGWFIAGCVIVFRNYKPDFDNTSSARYCNRIVYMYTFWLITSALILLFLFVSCVCCIVSVSCSSPDTIVVNHDRGQQRQQEQSPEVGRTSFSYADFA